MSNSRSSTRFTTSNIFEKEARDASLKLKVFGLSCFLLLLAVFILFTFCPKDLFCRSHRRKRRKIEEDRKTCHKTPVKESEISLRNEVQKLIEKGHLAQKAQSSSNVDQINCPATSINSTATRAESSKCKPAFESTIPALGKEINYVPMGVVPSRQDDTVSRRLTVKTIASDGSPDIYPIIPRPS